MKRPLARLSWVAAFAAVFLADAAPGKGEVFLHEEFENLDRWKPPAFPTIANHSTYAATQEGSRSVLRSESRASASGLVLSGSFDVRRLPAGERG